MESVLKNKFFEILEVERGSSRLFMTDTFIQSGITIKEWYMFHVSSINIHGDNFLTF